MTEVKAVRHEVILLRAESMCWRRRSLEVTYILLRIQGIICVGEIEVIRSLDRDNNTVEKYKLLRQVGFWEKWKENAILARFSVHGIRGDSVWIRAEFRGENDKYDINWRRARARKIKFRPRRRRTPFTTFVRNIPSEF